MFTTALILTFCTINSCEEYVIDYNLTKSDCIERKKEEINDMAGENFNQLYKDAVERYQAVSMGGDVVKVSLKCEAQ
jgi:hypothetical protein